MRRTARTGYVYLVISLLCALAGGIYERFSHGVYSFYMLYAFAFPLALGALPCYTLHRMGKKMPGQPACDLYHFGVAAWTAGSFVEGALEIYGTANPLTKAYWIGGAVLLMASFLAVTAERKRSRSLRRTRYETGRG